MKIINEMNPEKTLDTNVYLIYDRRNTIECLLKCTFFVRRFSHHLLLFVCSFDHFIVFIQFIMHCISFRLFNFASQTHSTNPLSCANRKAIGNIVMLHWLTKWSFFFQPLPFRTIYEIELVTLIEPYEQKGNLTLVQLNESFISFCLLITKNDDE